MNLVKEEKKYLLQTYKRIPLVLTRAKGKYVWDDKGRKYLDFFSGISVSNVGHVHPRVLAAVNRQSRMLMHVSNYYYTEPPVKLAGELVKASFPGQVFLSNSGAEANECALKIAKKRGTLHGGRHEIISFRNSFHGRTIATLSATGQEKFHQGFGPLLEGFRFAEFNDLDSVKKLINRRTAAIIIEPVQGEGGVNVATPAFMKGLKALCEKHDLLLIFDEIQTGLGRTGKLFAFEHFGIIPDIMTLAKSLAGGLPLGATVVGNKAAPAFTYGDHGSTFGGNPVSCAAAREVLRILSPALLRQAQAVGRYFMARLDELKTRHPFIREVRGMGLMLGVELDFPGKDIVQFCQCRGLIINCTQEKVLRFLPPLTINRGDVDKTIRILKDALSAAKAG